MRVTNTLYELVPSSTVFMSVSVILKVTDIQKRVPRHCHNELLLHRHVSTGKSETSLSTIFLQHFSVVSFAEPPDEFCPNLHRVAFFNF